MYLPQIHNNITITIAIYCKKTRTYDIISSSASNEYILQKAMFFLNGIFALKAFSPFKDVTVDDKWDQVNRSFVFMLMCLFGFFVTLHDYSGDWR